MAGYFIYKGKTTQNVITDRLCMVNIDSSDTITTNRNKVEGERTISRSISNEYGTIVDPLSFTVSLIKEGTTSETFTNDE